MGFQFWGNSYSDPSSLSAGGGSSNQQPAIVSILVSKTAGRYRVQSDSLSAMLLIVAELERRLGVRLGHLLAGTTPNNSSSGRGRRDEVVQPTAQPSIPHGLVTCSDQLPLSELFATITAHFETRKALNEELSKLNDCAHQFRMIQKRLLVRFKDRNPTPLAGLDTLMRESYNTLLRLSKLLPTTLLCTHESIISFIIMSTLTSVISLSYCILSSPLSTSNPPLLSGDSVEDGQEKLRKLSGDLSCLSRLVVLLAGLKFNMSTAERKLLESHMCPDIRDGIDQVSIYSYSLNNAYCTI
jgi:hypothetical protein